MFRTKEALVPLIRHICGVPLPRFTRVLELLELKEEDGQDDRESEEQLSQNVESGKRKLGRM